MDRDAEKADRQDQGSERDPGLAAEPVVDQRDLVGERDPGLAAEPVVDQESYGPDGQDGVDDQEADQAGRQPPPNS
jgi:hypothetical protein